MSEHEETERTWGGTPRFAGRFQVTRALQVQGGVWTWVGVDTFTGREVVLKATAASSLSARTLERLEREAHVLRELQGPSFAPPLSSGRQGDLLFLVAPRVPGETLEQRMERGPLSVAEALAAARSLLTVLQQVHARGILHRDIKPSNIIIGDGEAPPGHVTLIDFGLPRSDRLDLSLQSLPVRAARYLAPEQAGLLDAPVGPPADLYSLGVVLYEALAGRPPFSGGSVGEVLRQHLVVNPELRAQGVEVPRALEEVIQRLLQKLPQDRYQSAGAALADIEAIAAALARREEEPPVIAGMSDRRRTLAEPAFVGRRAELAALDRALERAREGRGGLLLLEGESGAGKTRLLDELARRSSLHGAWVLRGQGAAQAAPRPFQVFAGVFDELVRELRSNPALAKELRLRVGDLAASASQAVPALAEVLGTGEEKAPAPEAMREALSIRALAAALAALGIPTKPAVVLLDDCQWADEAALKLLLQLDSTSAEAASDRYVMVVASFRSEEVSPEHLLRRLAPPEHLVVKSFQREELQQLVGSMAGELPEEVLDLAVRLSEGNPFMTSAVLRGMVESGALRSTSAGWQVDREAMAEVRSSRQAAAVLSRRLRLLPSRTLHLLSVGAILGREFDVQQTAALAGEDLHQAVLAFEETRRRHILWVDASQGRYSFIHEKIREALLQMLAPEERRALHLLAAQHLEATGEARSFELAYHFDAAGEYERALPHALQAANAARIQHALEIAELHYRIAERGAGGAPSEVRQRVAEGLGDVLMLRGRYEEASTRLSAARALATDNLTRARTEGKLGELAFKRGDSEAAIQAIERALQLLGRRIPRRTLPLLLRTTEEILVQAAHTFFPRAFLGRRPLAGAEVELLAVRLYSRLAYAYWFQRGRMACLWAHLREMNLAERYPPTPELAQAYSEHAPALTLVPLLHERAIRFGDRSLALRRRLGDQWGEGQTLHFYGVTLYAASRLEDCLEKCRQAVRLLERTGDQWEVNIASTNVALALYRLGDLAGAVAEGQRIVRAAAEIGDRQAMRIGLEVWSKASGGRVPAEPLQREIAVPGNDAQSFSEVLQAEGVRLLRVGRPADAASVFERAHEVAESAGLRQEYVAPALPWLATALRVQAEQLSPLAASERDRLLRRALEAARQGTRIARQFQNNLPHALREWGLLAAMTGDPRKARRLLDESLVIAGRKGMRYEHAQTLLARARVGLALGWPGAAADETQAREQLRALGAEIELVRPDEDTQQQPVTLSLLDRFPRVLDAGRRIASALDRNEIFAAVREAVVGLLRVEQCTIIHPLPPLDDADAPSPPGVSLAALRQAVSAGRPVVVAEELGGSAAGARPALYAPILVRGKAAACLYATHQRLGDLLGDEEQRLTEFIATVAGAALENAEGFARIAALSEERGRLFEQAQEALRLRDDFIQIASHELKTPLTPLKLQLQSALGELRDGQDGGARDPARLRAKLERATGQVRRLTLLIETLLDLSQISRGRLQIEREPLDLAALARGVLEEHREALDRAGCETRLHAPEPVQGSWDRLRLEQVIGHLVSNALKYGAGKPIEVTVVREGNMARLSVRDFGIGISPEDQQRIFERFGRAVSARNYGGFGLGLWIAREVVEALGGTIRVESRPGEGALFTIELPLQAAQERQA